MLVLTRRTGQELSLGDEIVLRVLSIEGDRVVLGLSAPEHVKILRGELRESLAAEMRQAAGATSTLSRPTPAATSAESTVAAAADPVVIEPRDAVRAIVDGSIAHVQLVRLDRDKPRLVAEGPEILLVTRAGERVTLLTTAARDWAEYTEDDAARDASGALVLLAEDYLLRFLPS